MADDAPTGTQLIAVRQVEKLGDMFGIEGGGTDLALVLMATAFQTDKQITYEQMTALAIVAQQYHLNPWTKEIYAYPDKHKGIVPIVSVDGWVRIINEQPAFDGIEFNYSDAMIPVPHAPEKKAHEWIEAMIYRKDRTRPTIIREYFEEVYQAPRGQNAQAGPWQTHPKRFHRHKALIQTARVAFGFAGIYDQDEGERILAANGEEQTEREMPQRPRARARAAADRAIDESTARATAARAAAEQVIKAEGADKDAEEPVSKDAEIEDGHFTEEDGKASDTPVEGAKPQLGDPEWKTVGSLKEMGGAPAIVGTIENEGAVYIILLPDDAYQIGRIKDGNRNSFKASIGKIEEILIEQKGVNPPSAADVDWLKEQRKDEGLGPVKADETGKTEPEKTVAEPGKDAKPGNASQGMLDFLRKKARSKGITEKEILDKYKLEALADIDDEYATSIINWLNEQVTK